MPRGDDDGTASGEAELRERDAKGRIAELVILERRARDLALWDVMRASFAQDSEVEISWFRGTGAEFTDASAKRHDAGARSLHQIGASTVQLARDKATSDTPMVIVIIGQVDGVAMNVVSHTRVYHRFVRQAGNWLIAGLRGVHQTDMLIPVNPSDGGNLDSKRFAGFRRSYRAMSFMQSSNGQTPRNDLPGIDEPATVVALLAREAAWLAA